jgi:hypothetical protein
MRNSSSISESPGKMGLPVAISAKIAPIDHVSTAHAYFLHPRRISGARYHSVTTYHAAVGARVSDATWTHKTRGCHNIVTTYHAAVGARVSDATWTHKTRGCHNSVTTDHAVFGARVSDETWTHKTRVHIEWGG